MTSLVHVARHQNVSFFFLLQVPLVSTPGGQIPIPAHYTCWYRACRASATCDVEPDVGLAWTKAADLNIQSQTKTPAGQGRDPLDVRIHIYFDTWWQDSTKMSQRLATLKGCYVSTTEPKRMVFLYKVQSTNIPPQPQPHQTPLLDFEVKVNGTGRTLYHVT